jgi:hypothetical protein
MGKTMFHVVNAYTRGAQFEGLSAEASYRLQKYVLYRNKYFPLKTYFCCICKSLFVAYQVSREKKKIMAVIFEPLPSRFHRNNCLLACLATLIFTTVLEGTLIVSPVAGFRPIIYKSS